MIRPALDRILVRRDPAAETSAGGLFLPESSRWRGDTATVLAVGPGKKRDDGTRIPLMLKPGDRVRLPEYAGVEFRETPESELLSLVTEDEVIGLC